MTTVSRLRDVLNEAGIAITTTGLAECLWLASHLPSEPAAEGQDLSVSLADHASGESGAALLRNAVGALAHTERSGQIVGQLRVESSTPSQGFEIRDVQVPAARALRNARAMLRALRPLKQPYPYGGASVLSEEATAEYIADSDHWHPIFVAEQSRWLEAVIVADTGPSMWLWRPLLYEMTDLLGQLGAFRNIRVAQLAGDQVLSATGSLRTDAATLTNPSGRCVVFVLSDCSGAHWWDGRALRALRQWARHGPAVILQPLPERMWHRTAAPTVAGWATSPHRGARNTDLMFTPDHESLIAPSQLPLVPVVQIDSLWLGDWAQLIVNPNRPVRTAVTYAGQPVGSMREAIRQEKELGVGERVSRFKAAASPEALKLAASIAVSVPALPVMRLIQQAMIGRSNPSHLAEVILSGLLRPIGDDRYEFIDDQAREMLLATQPRSESWHVINVLQRVSAEIEQRAGAAASTFPALLELLGRPAGDGSLGSEGTFALVSEKAVRSLTNLTVPMLASPERAVRNSRKITSRIASVERAPYFYLSYAHTPNIGRESDPDRWVLQLYQDLCQDVLALTDAPPDSVGFMDRGLRADSNSLIGRSEAIATCRVFVPLYSPRYFQSEWCGREWYAFTRRILEHAARTGQSADAIVPALWVQIDPERLPDVARTVQFDHRSFGSKYSRDGFYGIMKLGRYRTEYKQAVFQLARRIIEIAHRVNIEPLSIDDDAALPSSFGANLANEGTRQIRITVAAPTTGDLPPGRTPYYYGRSARDWNPYRPESVIPVAEYVAEIARNFGTRPTVYTLEEYHREYSANTLADMAELTLIDPWVTRVESQLPLLETLGGTPLYDFPIVCRNNIDDFQTRAIQPRLINEVSTVIARSRIAAIGKGLDQISDPLGFEAVGDIVPALIAHAERQYLRRAPAYPPDVPPSSRPRLLGPVSEEDRPGDDG